MKPDQLRFEISLPADRRRELDALAGEVGISASDLARLAITRLLNGRNELVNEPPSRDPGNEGAPR
jgi:hypothetical protein